MFRSALRSSLGASVRSGVAARRFASSGSSPKASDMPWLLGSAAVFVPTGAYLFFTSSPAPVKHAAEATTHMQQLKAADQDILPEDAPTVVTTEAATTHKGSGRKIVDTTSDTPGEEANKSTPGGSGGPDDDKQAPTVTSSEEGRKAEDIPQAELDSKAGQDSLRQAESVNAPRAAMARQVEGNVEESGGKVEAAGEGRKAEDIPDAEIEKALHQAEEACVPRATMAHPERE